MNLINTFTPELKSKFDEFSGKSSGEVWVILYEGRFLQMPSGKSFWKKIGQAKNAFHSGIRYCLWDIHPHGKVDTHALMKELMDKGTIEFKNIAGTHLMREIKP